MTYKELMLENKISSAISKGIYSMDGKKINLERMSTFTLDALLPDDVLIPLNWKEWKKLKVKNTTSENTQKEFVTCLLNKVKKFGDKVDYNGWIRKAGKDSTFEEKIDKILSYGVKYSKKGIKK